MERDSPDHEFSPKRLNLCLCCLINLYVKINESALVSYDGVTKVKLKYSTVLKVAGTF